MAGKRFENAANINQGKVTRVTNEQLYAPVSALIEHLQVLLIEGEAELRHHPSSGPPGCGLESDIDDLQDQFLQVFPDVGALLSEDEGWIAPEERVSCDFDDGELCLYEACLDMMISIFTEKYPDEYGAARLEAMRILSQYNAIISRHPRRWESGVERSRLGEFYGQVSEFFVYVEREGSTQDGQKTFLLTNIVTPENVPVTGHVWIREDDVIDPRLAIGRWHHIESGVSTYFKPRRDNAELDCGQSYSLTEIRILRKGRTKKGLLWARRDALK